MDPAARTGARFHLAVAFIFKSRKISILNFGLLGLVKIIITFSVNLMNNKGTTLFPFVSRSQKYHSAYMTSLTRK